MKTTAKTIALVRLILGEIDMWEQRAQQIDADHTIDETCVSRHDETCPEKWRCDDCWQIDRAERMADMLTSAFEASRERTANCCTTSERKTFVIKR